MATREPSTVKKKNPYDIDRNKKAIYSVHTDEINRALNLIGTAFVDDPAVQSIGEYVVKLHNGVKITIKLPAKRKK